MSRDKMLMVRATPEMYADPAVARMAFSYADLMIPDNFKGSAITEWTKQVTADMMITSALKIRPRGNVPLEHWTTLDDGRRVRGTVMMDMGSQFYRIVGMSWGLQPTLLWDADGLTRGYLVATLVGSQSVASPYKSVVTPFLFADDELRLKLMKRWDKPTFLATARLHLHTMSVLGSLDETINVLTRCLNLRRNGRACASAAWDTVAQRDKAQSLNTATPRAVSRLLNEAKAERDEAERAGQEGLQVLADEVAAFSNVVVARLPIARVIIHEQIRQLVTEEKTNEN